ncbi:group II intron maturase-specific domain-containing protein [Clostridium sp. UBA6640]|uniref:group II intron maturase-specific domain-containing protein n=1 Tax=Clostridium sp. UBA6640 TaxID=1946370 RepID=UPI0039C897C0
MNIGWINYYGAAKCKGLIWKIDVWIRQSLRMCIWKQWKKVRIRYRNLKRLGLNHYQGIKRANTRKGYWQIDNSTILNKALTNQFFSELGLKN